MATHFNTVRDPDLDTALGTPSLTANDTVRLVQYDTTFLTSLDFATATNLDLFEAGASWTGDMGADGSSLELNCDLVQIFFGGATFRLSGSATLPEVWFKPVRPEARLILSSATVTALNIARGTAYLRSTAVGTNVVVTGGTAVFEPGGTAPTTLVVANGTAVLGRSAAGVDVAHGGVVDAVSDPAARAVQLTGTTKLNGGMILYRGSNNLAVEVGPAAGHIDLGRVSDPMTLTLTGSGPSPRVTVPAGDLVTVTNNMSNAQSISTVPVSAA